MVLKNSDIRYGCNPVLRRVQLFSAGSDLIVGELYTWSIQDYNKHPTKLHVRLDRFWLYEDVLKMYLVDCRYREVVDGARLLYLGKNDTLPGGIGYMFLLHEEIVISYINSVKSVLRLSVDISRELEAENEQHRI